MVIVIGIVLALIGILLIVAFVNNKIKCDTKTEATVSKIEVSTIPLRGTSVKQFTPVFTYTVNEKEYSQKADLSTGKKDKFTVGQKVVIYVNSKNPTNVRYSSNVGFFFAGLIIAFIGFGVIILACV